MSLTYQPFADTPDLVQLGKQLYQNVGESERLLSIGLGAVVGIAAISKGGWRSLALYGAAVALIGRGMSGHCPLYYSTHCSTRSPELPKSGDGDQPSAPPEGDTTGGA